MSVGESVANVTKAMVSTSLAIPFYAIDSAIRAGRLANSGEGQALDSLDAATQAMVSEILSYAATVVPPSPIQMAFSLINEIQGSVLGDLGRMASGDRSGLSMDGQTLEEIRNKWQIFVSVPFVEQIVGLEPTQTLRESVDKTYEEDSFIALWYIEGLGHWYGDSYWERGKSASEIRSANNLRERDGFWEAGREGVLGVDAVSTLKGGIEDGSLTMLNAGIGLSVAQSMLSTINHRSPASEIRRVVETVANLCRHNATPGFEGAAIESMGLVTRSALFSGDVRADLMVPKVAQALSETFGANSEELGFFWHGAGRAHYFAPPNLVPFYGSIEHGFEMVLRQLAAAKADDAARHSALAGFWWAVTVVNMRTPVVLENALARMGTRATGEPGFKSGVVSATIMRQDTTPDADFIEKFYTHTPKDEKVAGLWDEFVSAPAKRAVKAHWPALKSNRLLGQVFRYHQDLGALSPKSDAKKPA